jgi:Na+/proline symporter
VLGGAHADILTDASQGVVMLAIAIGIAFMAWVGYGVGTGFSDVVAKLDALDPNTTGMLNATHPLFDSWWDNVAVFIAHIPLGMLPHIGNKLWALNDAGSRKRFVTLLFALGLALPLVTLGGLLARAVLGDALFAEGATNNEAIPALFIALFSPWLAALLGIAILAAVMSTADGLVVSSSQIFANDIYRRTIAPRWHPHLTDSELDQRVLSISRWATIFVLAASAILAWQQLDTNVALIVWIGLGGMMAAIAGPVVLGALWKGVTRAGALAGFFGGATVFIFTKAALLPDWGVIAHWVNAQASNPYSCAALGVIAGVALTWLVSLFSEPLPDEHLAKVFGTSV